MSATELLRQPNLEQWHKSGNVGVPTICPRCENQLDLMRTYQGKEVRPVNQLAIDDESVQKLTVFAVVGKLDSDKYESIDEERIVCHALCGFTIEPNEIGDVS